MTGIRKYSADQPRDDRGRWTSGGMSDAARTAAYDRQVAEHGARRSYSRRSMANDLRTPDGGFTFDLGSNEAVTAGFAVSPYPKRSKEIDNISSLTDREIDHAVNTYVAANSDLLGQPNHYLGGWHDPKTGKGYLDVSVVNESAEEARLVGSRSDQIAFFDLQTFESVDIDRNAKSGQS